MKSATSSLLSALQALDEGMAELMLGLLTDELRPAEQRRFGLLFATAGQLLERHAELSEAGGCASE